MRTPIVVQVLPLVLMTQVLGCSLETKEEPVEQIQSSAGSLTTCSGFDTNFDVHPSLSYGASFPRKKILIQPDRKILAAGDCGDSACISRYSVDGTLDASFGASGTTKIDPDVRAGRMYLIYSAALQTTGKLVIAGVYTAGPYARSQGLLLRLLPNGTVDSSFGSGGRVYTDLGSSRYDGYRSLAIDGNDRIVVAGNGSDEKGSQLLVARHQADGPLDPTFARAGIARILDVGDTACDYRILNSVAVDSTSGSIFAAGKVCNAATYVDIVAIKLTGSGELDRSFGTYGGYTIQSHGIRDEAVDILINGGRIVVASNSDRVYPAPFMTTEVRGIYSLMGLTSVGRLDPSFGSAGVVSVDAGPLMDSDGMPLRVHMNAAVNGPDGKIITVGHIQLNATPSKPLLMRFSASGVLDSSIGRQGRYVWDCVTGNFSAVAVQSDRKIVTGGLTVIESTGAGDPRLVGSGMARFDP